MQETSEVQLYLDLVMNVADKRENVLARYLDPYQRAGKVALVCGGGVGVRHLPGRDEIDQYDQEFEAAVERARVMHQAYVAAIREYWAARAMGL